MKAIACAIVLVGFFWTVTYLEVHKPDLAKDVACFNLIVMMLVVLMFLCSLVLT